MFGTPLRINVKHSVKILGSHSLGLSKYPVLLSQVKVQMTKIYISVSLLQLYRHYFKDHTTENRMQKFQLVPEIERFDFEQF